MFHKLIWSPWSQSYDFEISNYYASVACSRQERFSGWKNFFQNARGIANFTALAL
jgi:hypothetical protein